MFAFAGCGMMCVIFHIFTLEEYYTGGLFLPPFNGISDASVLIITALTVNSFTGNEWMMTELYNKYRITDVFVGLVIFT